MTLILSLIIVLAYYRVLYLITKPKVVKEKYRAV